MISRGDFPLLVRLFKPSKAPESRREGTRSPFSVLQLADGVVGARSGRGRLLTEAVWFEEP
jgi:hypothetical protein